MKNLKAVANHLKVIKESILEIQEWANVLWVRIQGLGCRFVSKKVVKMEKTKISTIKAAEKIAALLKAEGRKASVWTKKGVRVYTTHGYLEIGVETADKSQIRYFTKSYEIKELEPIVKTFNQLFTVVEGEVELGEKVLWQEDEDGIIAPVGQHEPGVFILREWTE